MNAVPKIMQFGPASTARVSTMKICVLSEIASTLERVKVFVGRIDGAIGITRRASARQAAAIVEQDKPDALIVEAAHESDLEPIEAVAARHHGLPILLICDHQPPEFLLKAMRIGVREVLPATLTQEILQQAIGRIRHRMAGTKTASTKGKVIACLPCKGGSGATFLATNLAYALAAEGPRVSVLDLNLHFGEASMFISDETPSATLADVARHLQRLDGALLDSSMLKVLPNLGVLAAPDCPEKAVDVQPETVERLLAVARGQDDFIILDVGRGLDAVSIKALDAADEIWLVLQLTLPFIRDAKRLLSVFRTLGYSADKVRLIVNRYEKGGDISLEDVEEALGLRVFRTIPNSFSAVAASINQGIPLLQLAPRDPVSRCLRELARQQACSEERPAAGWLRSLLGHAS